MQFRASIRSTFHHWWFLLLLLLPQLLPPFAAKGYPPGEWGAVNAYIITHPVKVSYTGFYPLFQVIPLGLLIAAFVFRHKVSRWFNIYVAVSYVLIAFLQSITLSGPRGLSICTANLITFLLLAGLWIRESIHPQNQIDLRKNSIWQYWPLLLALIAFWGPVNPQTLLPDFKPLHLLTSGSGLSFCLGTPLYLAILILSFPQVNKTLLACTAFVGMYLGFSNLVLEFVIYPNWWWIGVLHFPLVILSLYGLYRVVHQSDSLT